MGVYPKNCKQSPEIEQFLFWIIQNYIVLIKRWEIQQN